MTKSPKCKSCINSPNYLWEQACNSFINYNNNLLMRETETYAFLILYYISILGD